MSKEKKPTMISLSLAGAIGYYLYNKLMSAGNHILNKEGRESADERTKRELSWRPEAEIEPMIEEPAFVTPAVIPFEEPVVEEEPVEEVVEEPEIEPVIEAIAEPEIEPVVIEEIIPEPVIEEVVEEGIECPSCGAKNAEGTKFCENCGSSMVEEPAPVVEETMPEPEAEAEPIVEEPVIAPITIAPIELNDEDQEPEVEALFEAVKIEPPKPMDNVVPLHNVDQKDASAKEEFKSIMDFFSTI